MAFVHCHECDWEQDDFWSLSGYNPFRWFFKYDIPSYWKPRFIGWDAYAVPDSPIARKLGFIRTIEKEWTEEQDSKSISIPYDRDGLPHPKTYTETQQFSWYVLFRSAKKWILRMWRQQWWTYESWRKAVDAGQGGCPCCGKSLCID